LIEELQKTPLNLPSQLEIYWEHKDFSGFTRISKQVKQDTEKHERFLKQELGKQGKSLHWFMTTHKDEIENIQL